MTRSSKNKNEAAQFIRFMLGKYAQLEMAKAEARGNRFTLRERKRGQGKTEKPAAE